MSFGVIITGIIVIIEERADTFIQCHKQSLQFVNCAISETGIRGFITGENISKITHKPIVLYRRGESRGFNETK